MTKTVLTYGLIASAITAAFMFGAMPFWKNGTITFDNGEIVGYTSMVIALSLIFFGVKSYRDKQLNGAITFGKALKVGFLIAGVAALGYATGWEFYFNLVAPDFMEEYASFCVSKAKSEGVPAEKVQQLIARMDQMKVMYKNPLMRFGMTMAEILPVGIVVALVSAGLLRKKEFLPTV